MIEFIDSNCMTWRFKINVGTIRKIRENVKDKDGLPVDLLDIVNDNLAFKLVTDPVLLSDIIWTAVKANGEDKQTREQFDEGFTAETLDKALNAFITEFTNFFPTHQKVQLEKIVTLAKEIQTAGMETLESQVRIEAEKLGIQTTEKDSGK